MKNTILIILFFISLFVVNVIFYYSSEDYQNFLKQMKGSESQELNIGEEKSGKFIGQDMSFEEFEKNLNSEKSDTSETNNSQNIDKQKIQEIKNKVTTKKTELKLGKKYQNILDLFTEFDLSPIDLNNNLFDITNEYPDKYFEYYSSDVTVYFFTGKSYSSVKDIFTVLSLELPFSLNETNIVGEKSLYINLDDDIKDNFVRMIIQSDGIVFGLKIKKNQYNNIRTKLDTLVK